MAAAAVVAVLTVRRRTIMKKAKSSVPRTMECMVVMPPWRRAVVVAVADHALAGVVAVVAVEADAAAGAWDPRGTAVVTRMQRVGPVRLPKYRRRIQVVDAEDEDAGVVAAEDAVGALGVVGVDPPPMEPTIIGIITMITTMTTRPSRPMTADEVLAVEAAAEVVPRTVEEAEVGDARMPLPHPRFRTASGVGTITTKKKKNRKVV